ncbi:MAG: VanW family protein [Anaerolineaceae bacterium]|nr:VanW family protein [Anaerolineaceae bacterium]
MSNNNSQSKNKAAHLLTQALTALGIGFLAFLFLLLSSITIFQLIYHERIFPGVYIHSTHVGGLTVNEAANLLNEDYQFSKSGFITLKYLEESFSVKPGQLGIHLNAVSTAEEAYQFGRSFPLEKWVWQQALIFAPHIEIAPDLTFNEQDAVDVLEQIGNKRNQPLIEAGLEVDGTQVTATPGQIGQVLNIKSSLAAIREYFMNPSQGTIDLLVEQQYPLMMDATEFIPLAQDILNQPFVIEAPEDEEFLKRTWTIIPENLAPMLIFKVNNEERSAIIPQVNEEYLLNQLQSMSDQVNSPPENPRFIFNDDTHQLDLLSSGKNGRTLNIEASMKIIQAALANGNHKAVLSIDKRSPAISNSPSAQELGITELVHQESSYFYGSDPARIHNIETASEQFHGLLVPPGETFSMANTMDEISLDTGYSEALIIYNGKTIKGIGGGVCQVSTTLFRTAFFSGFPIIERHPHAYRVSYYEKVAGNKRDSSLAGLDATVYIPLVDLKFINDTPYWLLMETYINRSASRLTWKFYSTYDGRTINWTTTGPTHIIKSKEPLYQLNTNLETGEIKQIDWEAEGADVTVSRTVSKDGNILFEDTFFTRYTPWRAVYEYGPGTEGIPTQSED